MFYYLVPSVILFCWLSLLSLNLATASEGCKLRSVRGITAFMVGFIPILTGFAICIVGLIYRLKYKDSDE